MDYIICIYEMITNFILCGKIFRVMCYEIEMCLKRHSALNLGKIWSFVVNEFLKQSFICSEYVENGVGMMTLLP